MADDIYFSFQILHLNENERDLEKGGAYLQD